MEIILWTVFLMKSIAKNQLTTLQSNNLIAFLLLSSGLRAQQQSAIIVDITKSFVHIQIVYMSINYLL